MGYERRAANRRCGAAQSGDELFVDNRFINKYIAKN
jgi:hypothetical protein